MINTSDDSNDGKIILNKTIKYLASENNKPIFKIINFGLNHNDVQIKQSFHAMTVETLHPIA